MKIEYKNFDGQLKEMFAIRISEKKDISYESALAQIREENGYYVWRRDG